MSFSISAHTIRRIAHATDSVTVSSNALNWAVQLAQEYRAELLLLHVVPPPTPIFEIESPMKSEAELAVALLLGKLERLDIKARGFLLTGRTSIDGQIVRAAKLARVDLLIMGNPNRSGLYRLLAGNVASRVITRAHCPVLVVPADDRSNPN